MGLGQNVCVFVIRRPMLSKSKRSYLLEHFFMLRTFARLHTQGCCDVFQVETAHCWPVCNCLVFTTLHIIHFCHFCFFLIFLFYLFFWFVYPDEYGLPEGSAYVSGCRASGSLTVWIADHLVRPFGSRKWAAEL